MNNAITAYDHQVEPVELLKVALKEQGRALCVMATGLGKTIVSALTVDELLQAGQRGLFLCHENDILEQAENEYRSVTGNHINYKTFYGDEKDWKADQAQMLFASFQSMNNHSGAWYQVFDPNHFDFMVVDESHHGQAATYKAVVEYFNCKKLGMTATPDREDGLDIRDLFGEEVVDIPLEVGIAKGWLTYIEYHVLSDGLSNRKLKMILNRVLRNKERISVKQLNETIFVGARTKQQQRIVEQYIEITNRSKGKKTMIFCENIEHAEHVLGYFENAGVVHSRRPNGENRDTLNKFRDGEIQYLISVDKLNEGIDVPNVEVVVFLRATDSKRIWYQQTGRGARNAEGKEKLVVLDFVANVDRLLALREMMDRVEDEVNKDEELKGKLSKRVFNVSGEGFEFNFSDDLVDLLKVLDVLKDGFYSTWQEASASAIEHGLTDHKKYQKGYKVDFKLPSSPDQSYLDFPGYSVFLGKKEAAEGWMTARKISLLSYIQGGDLKIKQVAEEYRKEHPEWFREFQSGPWFGEHYHPDLVKILKEKCSAKETAPEGWMTVLKIRRLPNVQVEESKIKQVAEEYRKEHPGWFRDFQLGSWFGEHCHPTLVKILKEKFPKRRRSSEGWMTANQIALLPSTQGQNNKIKQVAEEYRKEHPGWFRDFQLGPWFGEHYHPDLVKILKEKCSAKETAPEGWMTSNGIAGLPETKGGNMKIKQVAEEYRKEHPWWFKEFYVRTFVTEHYHPDLVKILKEKCAQKEEAPQGWTTARNMSASSDIKVGYTRIKTLAELHRKEHPEWFRDYRVRTISSEHYHPDLVKIIIEQCALTKSAPNGWMNLSQIAKLNYVQSGPNKIKARSNFFRKEHPEWFVFYWTRAGNTEHYHPDLVKILIEQCARKKTKKKA